MLVFERADNDDDFGAFEGFPCAITLSAKVVCRA